MGSDTASDGREGHGTERDRRRRGGGGGDSRDRKEKKERRDRRRERRERRERRSSSKEDGGGGAAPRRRRRHSTPDTASSDAGTAASNNPGSPGRVSKPRVKNLLLPAPNEQPKPVLSPSTRPSLTPRYGPHDRKWCLDGTPRGSVADLNTPADIPEDVFQKRIAPPPAMAPLPPVPDSAGYVGQYVQSAMTGDFIAAGPALFGTTEEDDARKGASSSQLSPSDFRRMMQTVHHVFAHIQSAVVFLFLLVVLLRMLDHYSFVWVYSKVSNLLQKVVNVVSLTALALSLCPLAVTNACLTEAEAEAAQHQEQHDGGESGHTACNYFARCVDGFIGQCCSRWGLRTVQTQGPVSRSKTVCMVSFVWVQYTLLSLIYGVIAVCCVITAAYDDVIWGYREQVAREYQPRSPLVSRNHPLVAQTQFDVGSASYVPGSECKVVPRDDDGYDPDKCTGWGCCYCKDCDEGKSTCTVPYANPLRILINGETEEQDPLFTWDMAEEGCNRLGRTLCTSAEVCEEGGDLKTEVSSQVTSQPEVDRLIPVSDQRWLMVNTQSGRQCERILAQPWYFKGRFQAFCCRACDEEYSRLEEDTDFMARTEMFDTMSTVRFVLALAGYCVGLHVQVSHFNNGELLDGVVDTEEEGRGTEGPGYHPRSRANQQGGHRGSFPTSQLKPVGVESA